MQLKLPNVLLWEAEKAKQTILKPRGNDIHRQLEDGQIRVAFQNARGIEHDLRRPAYEAIQAMKDNNIGIYGIVEPNCNFTRPLIAAINRSMKTELGNGFVSTASMKSDKVGYIPGGVMQAVGSKMEGRHEKSGSDRYGSFAWSKFTGKNGKKLTIITVYRVGQQKGTVPPQADSQTAHWQQVQAMMTEGTKDPDPRSRVLKDLTTFIDEVRQEGHEVLLGIDANEAVEANDSKIKEFAERNGLHDIHEATVRNRPATTRAGSRRRIDFMYATAEILQWVRASGYGAIDDGIQSDHILLWADFDMNQYFGGSTSPKTSTQSRPFTFDNIEMREKFIEHLKKEFEKNNIKRRVERIELELKLHGLNDQRARIYNIIDNDVIRSAKAALRLTIPQKQHGCARSRALSEAGNNVLFWKSLLSSTVNEHPITEKAENLGKRLDIDTSKASNQTANQLKSAVGTAWRGLKQCQMHAKELRKQWLESKARYKATVEGNDDAQKVLKTMVRDMEERQMNRNLTYITKGVHERLPWVETPTSQWYYSPKLDELYHYDKGVFEAHAADTNTQVHFYLHHTLKVIPEDALEVTIGEEAEGYKIIGECGSPIEWQRVTKQHDMEKFTSERNKRHLQQMTMEDSPPSQPDFQEVLKDYGCSPLADKILEGEVTTELDKFPPAVKSLLQNLRRTDEEKKCSPIDGYVHTDEYQELFKSVSEMTSSSPSGMTYTIWKCIASDDTLAATMTIMMRLPFMYGFKCDRWAHCIDVMLEKKAGVRRIHQLRIIGLVEADFNTALKLFFAKHMIANAESTSLTEEQWGGRPGRTAIDPALRKLLAFEYSRAMYVTIALFANDATACFDRMVPDLSTLVARKYGVTKNVMRCRNIVMEDMRHHIRTKHGDSKTTYGQESGDAKLAGETQGKGDVASIWAVESQLFLRSHQQQHSGIVLKHVACMREIRKNNDSFVDDTDSMSAARRINFWLSEKETAKQCERGAQFWADSINAGGGSIAFHKSFCQMNAYKDNTFPPEAKEVSSFDITLTDTKGAKTTITKKGNKIPNKGLGCLMAPSGQQESENKHRVKQCREIAHRAAKEKTDLKSSMNLLNIRILPAVTYSMPTTSFNTKQCRAMNTAIDPMMLNKLNFNKHMPKAVMYAPKHRAGHGYPSFEVIQDQKGLLTMLKHFRWMGTVGNDMLVVLSALQIVSGLCEPIMEEVETDLGYMGIGWFIHHRKRLKAMNGKMWIEQQWTPPLQRSNDKSLMKAFSMITGIKTSRLEMANYCRLYLRIITIADLANERGDRIPGNRMDGKWRASSTHEWPLLPCPPPKYWVAFRWCIRKAFVQLRRPGRLSKQVLLDEPLGPWRDVKRHIKYQYYLTSSHSYHRWGSNFLQYKANTMSNTMRVFEADGLVTSLPPQAIPIPASHNEHEMWTPTMFTICRPPGHTKSRAIKTTRATNGPDMAGSDGSVDIVTGDRASSACVQVNGTRYGCAKRYPSSQYSTSYRSELEGIKDTIDILDEVNNECSIEQFVDNETAVNNVNRPFTNPSQMLSAEADIILHCHHKKATLKAPLNLGWVKAHQDKDSDTPKEDMLPEVQLNEDCDKEAKQERLTGTVHYDQPYEGSGAMLIIDDKWVTSKYALQIQEASTLKAHQKYFLEKYPTKTMENYNNIYWRGIGMARKQLTIKEDINLTKYMNGWLNTGRQKGLFGEVSECPACGWHEETQLHMFECKQSQAHEARTNAIRVMTTYYHEKQIPAMVYVPFVKMVQNICDINLDDEIHQAYPPAIQAAITKQRELGGEFMLRGYLVPEWLQAIKTYEKDKPAVRMTHLYLGLWKTLLATVWEQRNAKLHSYESIVSRIEREQMARELIEWKRERHTRLSATQHNLVGYSIRTMYTWSNPAMRVMLELLEQAARNYRKGLRTKQRLITEFTEVTEPGVYDDMG